MAISVSSLAVQAPPQQATSADSLQLRPGQVLEARVLATGQDGQTRLSVGGQVIDAALQVKLQEGALIRLLVQGGAPNARLTVLPQPTLQGQGVQAAVQLPAQAGAGAGQQGASPSQALPPQGTSAAPPQSAALSSNSGVQTQPSQPVARNGAPVNVQPPANAGSGSGQAPASGAPASGAASQAAATPRAVIPASTGQAAGPAAPASSHGGSVQNGGPQQTLPPGTVLQLQKPGPNARPVLVQVSAPTGNLAANRPPSGAGTPATVVNPGLHAVVHTAQGAIARQDSIAALLTSLAGLGGKLSGLPEPVARSGSGLLASQLRLDGKPLDGATLKQALQRSGVFLESTLAKGAPVPHGDIKSGLLKLAGALRNWLGEGTTAKTPSENRPPPPASGHTPRAERPFTPQAPGDLSPRDAGARLLAQADAALSRMRLSQISSLPEHFARGGQATGSSPEMNMELPLLLGSELSVGQFQVLRDGKNGADRDAGGAWKMRFSINFSQTGEVGATVSLRGRKVGVMLWAEREDVAQALDDMLDDLEVALEARGLEAGALRCRHGHPPQARTPVGMFMDDCS